MSKSVCVTGASGAIGSWVVCLLLERGYTVHATIQDLEDENETKHLEAMEGAKTRLKFFEMDLLNSDSIAAAVKGCAGVIHLACPNIIGEVKDPEKQILEPAIQGTVNVLKVAKEAGVERVVATSSISAIIPSPSWPADKIKAEDCWTDLEYCKEKKGTFGSMETEGKERVWKESEWIQYFSTVWQDKERVGKESFEVGPTLKNFPQLHGRKQGK